MSKLYLVGPAGAGKTTRLVEQLVALIGDNVRPDRILALVPQKSQAKAFRAALAQARGRFKARGEPDITTFYGLAQQHVSLFFPLIAERAGFAQPHREPVMMNVEAAQYFLDQIVAPRIADFDDMKLHRPRLLGQLLDSMNKAAECGFGLDEIALRLGAAWPGEAQRLVSYRRAQEVALSFRQYCLAHNLLDFSLQIETFARYLLHAPSYRDYITARYRHVLVDNVEENPPVMHDFVMELLETCDTALLAEDDPGGYRVFLGADVQSARGLRLGCDEIVVLEHSYTTSPAVAAFGAAVAQQFALRAPAAEPSSPIEIEKADARAALGDAPGSARFWPGMVKWVADHIIQLTQQGVEPRDIAVLAPYVEDILRFELQDQLSAIGVRVRALRPSRPLYDHPIVRMLVTYARLTHPEWDHLLQANALARALSFSIQGLDIARAQLIADAAVKASNRRLAPLDDSALWERVGMRFYERYKTLQLWLDAHTYPGNAPDAPQPAAPLDLFWQQLFTDVLSQPGFGLNEDMDAGLVVNKLAQSARAFRTVFERGELTGRDLPAASALHTSPELDISREYITIMAVDVFAAQYAPEREPDIADDNAVLVTPAYTYLISNLRSRYQFWLDINSLGWYERIRQPLTHPYVLSRRWTPGRVWTDEDEHVARQQTLTRILRGLTYACADKVFVVASQLGINGQEESGPLARAIQRVLRGAGEQGGEGAEEKGRSEVRGQKSDVGI